MVEWGKREPEMDPAIFPVLARLVLRRKMARHVPSSEARARWQNTFATRALFTINSSRHLNPWLHHGHCAQIKSTGRAGYLIGNAIPPTSTGVFASSRGASGESLETIDGEWAAWQLLKVKKNILIAPWWLAAVQGINPGLSMLADWTWAKRKKCTWFGPFR